MASGFTYFYFIYVNVMFMLILFSMIILSNIQDIKNNWPLYRCNPLYMPLSDDIGKDFTYCVQNMQTAYLGFLLEPVNYIIYGLASLGESFQFGIFDLTNLIGSVRTFIEGLVGSIFGLADNITNVFQQQSIALIGIFKRITAAGLVMVYVMDGFGQFMVGGGDLMTCFHPNTKIKTNKNIYKKIKHLKKGDILHNGSIILKKLKYVNNDILYNFEKQGCKKKNIYVSGKHYVRYNNKFIPVEKHPENILQNKKPKYVYNLITHDHLISIGKLLFWDYEDDILN